jgi:hypothetical protein
VSNYFMWRSRYIEGKCVLMAPKKIEKAFQLERGISREETWPVDVTCEMSQEFPKDIELTDNLHGSGFFVVSRRLRDFMTKYGVGNVEYLPVQILNHKKKLASKDYFILNPLSVIDCVDVEASEVEWDVVRKDFIESCESLVVRDSLVPTGIHVFRPKHLESDILVRSELVDGLKAARLEGLLFTRAEDFQGA